MKNIEAQLPNGFHDGVLLSMAVDFSARVLTFEIEFWIGDMESARREVYRAGRVEVSGLGFVIIDPPGDQTAPLERPLTIDGGDRPPSTDAIALPFPEAGGFEYWLFVNEWNSFIRFSG